MRAWVRLGLAAFVMIAAFVGIRMIGEQPILLEDVEATSHGGAMVGVTMTIRNSGLPDRLLSVEATGAKLAMIMSEKTDPLPIPGLSSVSLASDGAHIMIGGLSGELEEGRLIPLLLNFENAGAVSAKARVVAPAKSGDKMDHSSMGRAEYIVPEGEVGPTLSLTASPQAEGGYVINIETMGFEFSQEKADGPHEKGVGHGHLYVSGVKIGRVYGATATVSALPAGEHNIRVTLNTNDHRTYVVDGNPVTAVVTVGE